MASSPCSGTSKGLVTRGTRPPWGAPLGNSAPALLHSYRHHAGRRARMCLHGAPEALPRGALKLAASQPHLGVLFAHGPAQPPLVARGVAHRHCDRHADLADVFQPRVHQACKEKQARGVGQAERDVCTQVKLKGAPRLPGRGPQPPVLASRSVLRCAVLCRTAMRCAVPSLRLVAPHPWPRPPATPAAPASHWRP
jgi:hypothetical protein